MSAGSLSVFHLSLPLRLSDLALPLRLSDLARASPKCLPGIPHMTLIFERAQPDSVSTSASCRADGQVARVLDPRARAGPRTRGLRRLSFSPPRGLRRLRSPLGRELQTARHPRLRASDSVLAATLRADGGRARTSAEISRLRIFRRSPTGTNAQHGDRGGQAKNR